MMLYGNGKPCAESDRDHEMYIRAVFNCFEKDEQSEMASSSIYLLNHS